MNFLAFNPDSITTLQSVLKTQVFVFLLHEENVTVNTKRLVKVFIGFGLIVMPTNVYGGLCYFKRISGTKFVRTEIIALEYNKKKWDGMKLLIFAKSAGHFGNSANLDRKKRIF